MLDFVASFDVGFCFVIFVTIWIGLDNVLYAAFNEFSAKNRTATAALVFIGWRIRMRRVVCQRYHVDYSKRTRIYPGGVGRAKSGSHAADDSVRY